MHTPPKCLVARVLFPVFRSCLYCLRTVFLLTAVLAGAPSQAATISFATPAGSMSGGDPVNAKATFITSADTITVVIENLQTDTVSIMQNVSELAFQLSTGPLTGTLVSSSAMERKIRVDGSFLDKGIVSTGWSLLSSPSGLLLTELASAVDPTHTIVGPPTGGAYSSANRSVAGATKLNPFLAETATFELHVAGVTADTTITKARFTFGNDDCLGRVVAVVPEPSSLALGVLGAATIAWRGVATRRGGRRCGAL
jgi:hypothetical protein